MTTDTKCKTCNEIIPEGVFYDAECKREHKGECHMCWYNKRAQTLGVVG